MTTWGDLEVGSRIIYRGGEFADMEHVVKVLKRGGLSVRAVLEPVTDQKAAKVAVRARLDEEVDLPEGAAAPDRPGSAITSVLGGKEVASLDLEDGVFITPVIDITTVASHLRIMHGVELQGLPVSGEDELLRIHTQLHEAPFHEPPYPHRHEGKSA